MAEIGSAFLTIAPSMKGFDTKLNASAGGTLRSSGKTMGGVFAKAFVAAGALIAAAGIGSFLKGAVEEAREAQKVGAATTAILKATGGAAKISAGQIGDLASSLSAKTAVDDEQIQAGENLLLTFKNVKREGQGLNDVFGRATAAGLDLAAAGFGSIEGNAKQLGKALNDPTKGIAALGKAGVTFTEAQKTQIAGFVKSNDLLSAQKIILGEVEAQVGGTAAATATSGEKAAVAFGNIKEQVGTALLPAIDSLFKLFLSQVPRITSLIASIGPAFTKVTGFVQPLTSALTNLIKNNLKPFFAILAGAGGAAVAGLVAVIGGGLVAAIGALVGVLASPLFLIGALVGVLALAYQRFAGFRAIVDQVVASVRANFLPVLQSLAATFTGTILPAITSFASYVAAAVLPIFQQVAAIVTGQVLPILRSLGAFFIGTLVPAVAAIVAAVGQRLKPIFDQLVATFRGSVLPALQQILAAFQRNLPTIKRIASAVVSVIGFFLKLAASILGKVVPVLIRLAGFIISKVVPVLISIVSAGLKAISGLISFGKAVGNAAQSVAQFAKKVGSKIAEVVSFFKALPGKIKGLLSGLPGELKTIGGNIIDGLKNGITAAGARVLAAVRNIIDKIPKFIRQKMGIASPSKVTTKLGAYIGDGLGVGISSRTSAVESAARATTAAAGKAVETEAQKAAKKAKAAAKKLVDGVRDTLRDRLSGFRDDFASLSDTIKGRFTDGLFGDATTGSGLLSNLTTAKGNVASLLGAFKTLRGFGLPSSFLAQLFSDGGAPLILDLAANKDQATAAGSLFGDIQSISSQLGDAVATEKVGPKIDATNALLTKLVSLQGKAAVEFAKEINGAATAAKKRGNKSKGDNKGKGGKS